MKLGHSERERKGVYGLGGLVENCVVYGDRGYRGCEGVIVCGRTGEGVKALLPNIVEVFNLKRKAQALEVQ